MSDHTDDKIKEGVEHLQQAALELIAAARVLLDLAEQAVRDPSDVVAAAAELAGRVQRSGSDPDVPSAVQRIRVV